MKIKRPRSFKLRNPVHLVLYALFIILTACSSRWEINNPYEHVNWEKYGQYKANLHTHTTISDGRMAPQTVVDQYHQLGYQILAITDHNEVTYPWTAFASLKASSKSEERLANGEIGNKAIIYENRNPKELGMIAIQGNEVSAPHHVNSYFSDYCTRTSQEDSTFIGTAEKNGLLVINHPGRYKYNAQWYTAFYKKYKHIIGMEIYNNGDRYPGDRQLWDSVLVALLPAHPVWAYSNDDMHSEGSIGRNWNIFILPELTEDQVRKGMEEGRSFYVYAPEGHKNQDIPKIQSIQVNRKQGQIQIIATGQDSIHWISGGKIVQKGNRIKLDDCPDFSSYVRAEIFGSPGIIIGTQPFVIQEK